MFVACSLTLFPVSRSPLNEDVFTMPQGYESRVTTPDVVQLSEQIHRVLVQPVHSGSSQGYSSLGSSGSRGSRRSHQQHHSASATSSSDSNGPAMNKAATAVTLHKPVSFAERRVVFRSHAGVKHSRGKQAAVTYIQFIKIIYVRCGWVFIFWTI